MNNSYAVCGDCMQIFPHISEHSVDMILADLPYQITKNTWDNAIPLEEYIIIDNQIITLSNMKQLLWKPSNKHTKEKEIDLLLKQPLREILKYWQKNKKPGLWWHYKNLLKPNGIIVLFGTGRFSAELVTTGKDIWRYNLIWKKNHPTGFLNANKMPLRAHEDILIFYKKLPVYHPQKTFGNPRKISTAHHKRNCQLSTNYGFYKASTYDSTERYPTSIWSFPIKKNKASFHPTQKPLALIEELIKTYSDESNLILDNCAGSFTTAVACDNLKRKWIAIEKDEIYFRKGINRVNENRKRLGMNPVKNIYFYNMGAEQ